MMIIIREFELNTADVWQAAVVTVAGAVALAAHEIEQAGFVGGTFLTMRTVGVA